MVGQPNHNWPPNRPSLAHSLEKDDAFILSGMKWHNSTRKFHQTKRMAINSKVMNGSAVPYIIQSGNKSPHHYSDQQTNRGQFRLFH